MPDGRPDIAILKDGFYIYKIKKKKKKKKTSNNIYVCTSYRSAVLPVIDTLEHIYHCSNVFIVIKLLKLNAIPYVDFVIIVCHFAYFI